MIMQMAMSAALKDELREARAENERLRAALTHESEYRRNAVAEATRLRAVLVSVRAEVNLSKAPKLMAKIEAALGAALEQAAAAEEK